MDQSPPVSGGRAPDHILGVFERARLSEALSATHRAGYGPHTRVLDGRRASTLAQLSRAGLQIAEGPLPAPEDLVILVLAPGRVDRVAELFHQLGAQLVAKARRGSVPVGDALQSPLAPVIEIPVAGDEITR